MPAVLPAGNIKQQAITRHFATELNRTESRVECRGSPGIVLASPEQAPWRMYRMFPLPIIADGAKRRRRLLIPVAGHAGNISAGQRDLNAAFGLDPPAGAPARGHLHADCTMTSTVASMTSTAPEAGRAKSHIRGTSLSFGSGPRAIEVLRGINLKINDGEFVTLIGPSGSGKSTLLNLVSDTLGHVEPSVSGSIEIDWRSNARSRLGYILQKDTLLPWRTLIENVEIGIELQGVSKRRHAGGISRSAQRGPHGAEHARQLDISQGRIDGACTASRQCDMKRLGLLASIGFVALAAGFGEPAPNSSGGSTS
jgi:hypothetical protein